MKKLTILSLALLVGFSGCGGRKKAKADRKKGEVRTHLDIPVAGDGVRSVFNDDLGEFAFADEDDARGLIQANIDAVDLKSQDYSWIEESADGSKNFKVVYFNFDSYTIRQDQESVLAQDIATAKKLIEESKFFGSQTLPTIVIDGHACHSAGSRVYNLALSEKRAKVLEDRLVAAGIPTDCIKIVGRGSEMPALIDGKPVEGDRAAQWPNRRDEIRIIYA